MEEQSLNGIINVLKPPGMTSHDVINRLRRILGIKRIGHGGTLDPGAAGVLLTAAGKATRIIEYLAEESKTYHAILRLGAATSTQDSFGSIVFTGNISHLNSDDICNAFKEFHGKIWQTPPMVSAIKHQGKKLYEFARKGIEVPRVPRIVRISSLKLIDICLPMVAFEVTCSKGTYVRTLCHDIGLKIGCGAHLYYLLRTSVGSFKLDASLTLEEITAKYQSGNPSFLSSMAAALINWPKFTMSPDLVEKIKNGRSVSVDMSVFHGENKEVNNDVVIVDEDNNFVAICCLEGTGVFKTFTAKKVFI